MKKLFLILSTCCCMFLAATFGTAVIPAGAMPVKAQAEETVSTHSETQTVATVASGTWGSLSWTLDESGTLNITGNGSMNNFSFSSTSAWHAYKSQIKEIIIGDSVTSIGTFAFDGCSNLTSITIPDGVTSIGNFAFSRCSNLTSITIPDGVTNIGVDTFDGCSSLTSITIPDSVTSIGSAAFRGCSSLTSITIPDSVTSIGDFAFQGCGRLWEVVNNSSLEIVKGSSSYGEVAYYAKEVRSGESSYAVVDGYEFITTNGVHSLIGYRGDNTNLILPVNYNGNNYEIAKYAFSGRKDITSITIPENIRNIDVTAFKNIANLDKVTFNAIYCADMTSSPFSGSGGDDGFTVEFGAKVAKVPAYLFYNCNVTDVAFAENCICAEIGERAFYGCDMLTFTIPDYVTTIGSYAFNSCYNLTSVTVGAAVTSIGSEAFRNCYKLVEVINKSSLTFAGSSVNNYGCLNLYAIEVHSEESKLINVNDYLFYPNGVYYLVGYVGDDTELSLPADCNGVRNYTVWNYAFYQNDDITSVVIPDYVVSIGNYAFGYCDNLESVTIGDGLASIQSYAFAYCDKLVDVIIGEGYPEVGLSIGSSAFYDCDGLVYIVLPETTSSIGNSAFYGCSKLESVSLGRDVKSIGSSAFSNCSALKSIRIGENITSIGNSAFSSCSALKIIYVDAPTIATALTSATACGSLINNAEVILINKNLTSIATFVGVVFSDTEDIVVDGKNYTSYSLHTHSWEDRSIEKVQCEQDGFSGAVCTICGLNIGETVSAHDYSQQSNNETHHWEICKDCGDTRNEVLHTWNSGVITTDPTHLTNGVKTFTCVVCQRYYMETVDKIVEHTYNKQVATETYLVSLATCEAKAVYNYSCECGAKGTETFEYGEVLGHTYGAWVNNGNNTHTKTCGRDSTHKVTENCVGGTATCTAKAVCESCNSEYGEVLGHTYGEWVSNGNNTHTKTCGRDSTHKVTENCAGGTATCTAKAVCESCNRAYGEKQQHVYQDEWKNDESSHWKECSCGDKSDNSNHTWDDGVVTKEATSKEEGEKTYTCSICALQRKETLAKKTTSTGTIVGIAAGSAAVAGTGGFSLFWFVIKKKKWSDLIALFKK